MANLIYNQGLLSLANGEIDLDNGAIKGALVGDAYTPDQSHNFFSDVTNEISGAGYTAGGQAIANVSLARDNVAGSITLVGDDLEWPSATILARAVVVYSDSGDPGTSPLLAYYDFGQEVGVTNAPFVVEWATEGILSLSTQ